MQIVRIEAENLFSWKKLDINFTSGTYSFSGENGVGKSSILEIISWVLFKKSTKKNIKGDYGGTDGWGAITFDDDIFIKRETKSPTSIIIGDGDHDDIVEQDYVDKFLRCSHDMFMAANMCSQKRVSSFINEKTDTGKGKIFADMLGAGILDKIRSKSSKLRNDHEIEYESIKSKYDLLGEQLETMRLEFGENTPEEYKDRIIQDKEKLKEMEEKVRKFESVYNQKMKLFAEWKSYEDTRALSIKNEEQIKCDVEELKEKEVGLEEWGEFNQEEWDKLKELNDKFQNKVESLRASEMSAGNEIIKIKDVLKLGKDCPTCGASINENRRNDLKDTLNKQIKVKEAASSMISEFRTKKSKVMDRLEKLQSIKQRRRELIVAIDTLKKRIESANKLFVDLVEPKQPKPDIESLGQKLNSVRSKLFDIRGGIKDRINLFNSFKSAERGLKEAENTLKEREKKYSVSKWLFTNIPLIKLMYIDEHKLVLENLINENISNMNLPFIVKIDTQRQLKSSKEVKDEFSFTIMNTDKKVDKNDLSGGEETMILLATQFAINDLIKPNIDLEIYDEVFGALDERHIDMLLEIFGNRGNGKQLFLISHKDEITNAFSNVIKINKDGRYSYVQGT